MVSVRGLRLEAWRERARESFWVVPLLGVMLAVVVGGTLPRLELRLESMQMFWLFDGGPDAARSVLSSIAGSMITVTSLTFSLTVVTLQLASSQFSPRLLRSFLRDLRNQAVLALLLATFTFSLLVMLTVRTQDERGPAFVPPLSVTLAVVMVIASVVALVWFIGHIVTVVRVGHIMSDVTKESVELLEHEADSLDSPASLDDSPPDVGGQPVRARGSGFVQTIDVVAIGRWASENDGLVHVCVPPGAWVVRGTPWAYVEGADPDALSVTLSLGAERTSQQDVGFGIRQLVDIALRALSPGINDPTTAVDAIGHIGDILVMMSERKLGARSWSDAGGTVRVHAIRPSFADHLEMACGQIRRFGGGMPLVMGALIDVLGAVGSVLDDRRRREAILRELADIAIAADEEISGVRDMADLRGRVAAARARLGAATS